MTDQAKLWVIAPKPEEGKNIHNVVHVLDILSHFQIKTHTFNHKQLPGQRGQKQFLPQIRVSVALCVLCQQQLALLSHPSVILSPLHNPLLIVILAL